MHRPRGSHGYALAGCALAALLLAPWAGAAESLAPHVARYALTLHPSSRGGEVAALRGRLEVRFAASCDGWELIQSLGFRMLGQDGATLEHLAHLTAFEERNGSGFVFNMRTWEDRELVEALAGTARRETGMVRLRYAQPEERVEELPPDTVFPAQHVRALLAAARAGERVVMRTVFDGSSEDNPFQVSTAIGPRRGASADAPPALAGRASWPLRLAYFDLDAVEPRADFEMSVTLFDNGVAGDMVYDYGDFAIDVRLEEVELLPLPGCP
jgi:hypothetical protein